MYIRIALKIQVFSNLKKYLFYQDKFRFLRFVMSFQGIKLEKKKIEAMKT